MHDHKRKAKMARVKRYLTIWGNFIYYSSSSGIKSSLESLIKVGYGPFSVEEKKTDRPPSFNIIEKALDTLEETIQLGAGYRYRALLMLEYVYPFKHGNKYVRGSGKDSRKRAEILGVSYSRYRGLKIKALEALCEVIK